MTDRPAIKPLVPTERLDQLIGSGDPTSAEIHDMAVELILWRRSCLIDKPEAGEEVGTTRKDCATLAKVFEGWLNAGRQPTFSAGDMRHIIATLKAAASPSPVGESREALIERLVGALSAFAEAADIFKREYGDKMKPDTGCNIKFSALCEARAAVSAAPKQEVQEAVAWLFEGEGWGREVMLSYQEALDRRERLSRTWDIKITPLYASPPSPLSAGDAGEIKRLRKALEAVRWHLIHLGWKENSVMIEGIDKALKKG